MVNQPRQSLSDSIWNLFVSIKFTVLLLTLWLIASVVGTFIPQNAPPAQYVELYGPNMANWMMRFGFFDVYHTTWYALILLLLLLAVTACSLNSFEAKRALAFRAPASRRVSGSGKKHVILTARTDNPQTALDAIKAALGKTFKQIEDFEEDGARRLYTHRQPWAHFMVYLVHASVVFIILGGMISALFGFEGRMVIEDKTQTDVFTRHENGMVVRGQLPFLLRLNSFEYQRFADGRPKDWVSHLSVIDEGNEVETKSIEVNDPLSYGIFNFYQSSWIERAKVSVQSPDGTKKATAVLGQGDETFVPEFNLALALESQFQRGKEQVLTLLLAASDGEVRRLVITGDPEENANRQADLPLRISLDSNGMHYATVLQVVSDPGVGLVWFGCFLMMVGLYLTFYTSHRRVSVLALPDRVEIRGLAQRNVLGFRRELEAVLRNSALIPSTHEPEETP